MFRDWSGNGFDNRENVEGVRDWRLVGVIWIWDYKSGEVGEKIGV